MLRFSFTFLIMTNLALASGSYSGSSKGASSGSKSGGERSLKLKEQRNKIRQRQLPSKTQTTKSQKSKFDHSHKAWGELLKKYVKVLKAGSVTQVDYKNFDKKKLKAYTDRLLKLSKASVDSWSKDDQLAYYINLYNALTVQRVQSKYPIKSIKDLGSGFFTSAWKVKFFTLFGEESYLDRIEHELVRGSDKFNDPRIHMAFNCASIGCPALIIEPFVGKKLDQQLEKAVKDFLKDRDRNRYNPKRKRLEVSKIFDWYEGDFEKGFRGQKSLRDFFASYADSLSDDPKVQALIQQKKVRIDHLDYDWNLNKVL